MVICNKNVNFELRGGLLLLKEYLKFEISKSKGIKLTTEKISERKIVIKKENDEAVIAYNKKSDFFYAFTNLFVNIEQTDYFQEINCPLKDFGVMLDCSRNAVLNVDSIKRYIVYLALLGYDYLELYTEDTYEIEEEPYFGYMRGRYTRKEIREIDNFAKLFGVELVPCIQTLGHLDGIFRWQNYKEINDTANILLLKDERTYALIEKMFQAVSESYSSRRINLGMDEAHLLGSGRFLKKNGYVSRSELMLEHLKRVTDIARRYGFTVSVWNDMFFKAENGGEYRVENPCFSEELLSKIPQDIRLVYWDYVNEEEEIYEKMLKNSLRLTENTGFAGGIRTWNTFTADTELAIHKIIPAVNACRKYKIKDILVTVWGDDGGEASLFSALAGLCVFSEYVHKSSLGECDKILKALFNYTLEELKSLDFVNRYVRLEDMPPHCDYYGNPAKYLLYNDLFYGLYDSNVPSDAKRRSEENYKILTDLSKRESYASYLFDTMSKLAKILVKKADLSIRIKEAYDKKDKESLLVALEDIEDTLSLLNDFIGTYEAQWLKENKPFGFEVQQIRLGGLAERMKYVKKRIQLFLENKIEKIEELEEKRLPSDKATVGRLYNPFIENWKDIVSCGKVAR